MEALSDGRHELERHFERQMRAQERQLAWVRLGLVALGVAVILIVPDVAGAAVLLGVLGMVAAWSLAVPWLLRRFPAREVGIVSTGVEMAAVTIAVYVATDAPDLYLLYGLVILGAALRFGLGASVWSSLVMSAMYLAVVILPGGVQASEVESLPIQVGYLVGFGVVAGLFSRIVIGRATENAQLQARLDEEERELERTRERELLSRLGRDFNESLERGAVLERSPTAQARCWVARRWCSPSPTPIGGCSPRPGPARIRSSSTRGSPSCAAGRRVWAKDWSGRWRRPRPDGRPTRPRSKPATRTGCARSGWIG